MSADATGTMAADADRGASFWRDVSLGHAANGLVGFLFAASGPLAIVLAAGTKGGLSEADLASWVFGSLFVNGIVSIIFCLRYRQPLVFFWTIPGTVLIAPALSHLSFAEVIGAYLVTGLLMTALGLAGWVQRAMQAIPMPVVMGMVAGVFLSFGLDWVRAFQADLAIAAAMTAAYFAVSADSAAGETAAAADRDARRRRGYDLACGQRSLSILMLRRLLLPRACMRRRYRGQRWPSWCCRSPSACWWCRTARVLPC